METAKTAIKVATDYDEDPVLYCARCYSLKIRHEDTLDMDYCDDCGCTDTVESSIEDWEEKYQNRYGHRFAERSNDVRNHYLFKLPISKLMDYLSSNPLWDKIIRKFYPSFPGGLSKADSIILLFNKLIHDCRLDEFKISLIRNFGTKKEDKNGREENK